jgi:saccharopine dehydrogenase (NAD+, L-lysine-forming)
MGAREMKNTKNILILGGYGRTGMEIAKLLLRESRHNIHLAGRDLFEASRAAKQLNWKHSGERVTGVEVNVALKKQLTGVLVDHDLVIDSILDTAFGGQIVQAALDAGIDYINLNTDKEKRLRLKELDVEIRASGLTFITEAGFVPGAPSLMARYVADFFDSLDVVTMGGLLRQENGNNGRGIGLVPPNGDIPMIFRDGSWQKANLTASRKIDFGKGQCIQPCYPMDMPELYSLPETLGCREFGFYGSGVNRLADMTI